MCLIIFAHKAKCGFPLILAANRDEFFSRPTQQAAFWKLGDNQPSILAGKDLLAGGTWLGLSNSGHFSAVTNISDQSSEQAPRSRGELPLDFLESGASAEDYARSIPGKFQQYAGFNLLLGDENNMYYLNNRENLVYELKPGIYGLSNGLINSAWPKVNRGRKELFLLMQNSNSLNTDELINMMNHRELPTDENLADTGVYPESGAALSSAFILNTNRGYGTMCTTAIIASQEGEFWFSEQNYNDDGIKAERHCYKFSKSA